MKDQLIKWLLLALAVFTPALRADDQDFLLRVAPANLQGVLNAYQLELEGSFPQQDLYRVEWEGEGSVSNFIQHVRRDARVLGFEPDQEIEAPEVTPGAPLNPSTTPAQQALQNRTMVSFHGTSALAGYVQQPAGNVVRLAQARTMATGAGTVAVIDTGVDPNHSLLRGALVNGYDFTRNIPGANEMEDLDPTSAAVITQEAGLILEQLRPTPLNEFATVILSQEAGLILEGNRPPSAFGHGTMVAGVIHLVAPTARIMPLKAFTALGTASLFNITRAIYYAADNGAKVINMSFTLTQPSDEFTRAVNYAAARGIICVGAAGNEGRETITYPAGYHNVIGVASTNNNDVRSMFSNFGAALVSLAGPGEGLVTAYPGGSYATVWGTSFSAPLVSATAALMLQVRPASTYQQVEQALRSARWLGVELGAGRLDVASAVAARLAVP